MFLKSNSQEIIIKGNSKEGHTDVFAYEYYDDNRKKLGGLFIVGNVKQEDGTMSTSTEPNRSSSPDIAYVTNLVASLAKREYYSSSEMPPREAFSATLKKINNVVEEFFTNKSLRVNIGIFAIAGEQILISKLGKFKIILARESRTVDILNNIDLFKKDPADEKEFSNVISGKIMPGDRFFAFYPSRSIVAREKFIATSLLKFKVEQFVEKIHSIREIKPDFDCSALYISLSKHREPTTVRRMRLPVPEAALDPTKNSVNLTTTDFEKQNPLLSRKNNDNPANVEQHRHSQITEETAGKPLSGIGPSTETSITEASEEAPRIISSEFSLGRKTNPILVFVKTLRKQLPSKISLGRKLIILALIVGILVIGVIIIKKFIVTSPEQRQLNTVLSQAKTNLKLARTNVSQNNLISVRQLLTTSLLSIGGFGSGNDRVEKTIREINEILDDIDKAVEVSPSLLETMPSMIQTKVSNFTTQKEKLESGQYNIAHFIAFDIYENNLYVLTLDNIFKVADINQGGKKEATIWLKSGALPEQASLIAVDGNIYVMNKSGILTTYYKGEKNSETNTYIALNDNDALLVSKDSDKLYVVNKSLGRIYELNKISGLLTKTFKVGNAEPFTNAYLDENDTIIITTKDNRVWELK